MVRRKSCTEHSKPIVSINLGEGRTYLCEDCVLVSPEVKEDYEKVMAKVSQLQESTDLGRDSWNRLEIVIKKYFETALLKVKETLAQEERQVLALVRNPAFFSHFRKDSEKALLQILEIDVDEEESGVKRILKQLIHSNKLDVVDQNLHLINVLDEFGRLLDSNKFVVSNFSYNLSREDFDNIARLEKERMANNAKDYASRYKKKGDLCYEEKNFAKAIEFYNKAVEMDGEMYNAFNRRGNCYHVLQDYNKALSDFDQALSIKKDFAIAYYNKGNCLRKLKMFKQSIAQFDRSLELNPNHADSYINKGVSHKNLKQLNEAIDCYEKALKINSKDHIAHYNRALCLIKLSRIEEALDSYKEALNLQPTNPKYQEEMKELMRKMGLQMK